MRRVCVASVALTSGAALKKREGMDAEGAGEGEPGGGAGTGTGTGRAAVVGKLVARVVGVRMEVVERESERVGEEEETRVECVVGMRPAVGEDVVNVVLPLTLRAVGADEAQAWTYDGGKQQAPPSQRVFEFDAGRGSARMPPEVVLDVQDEFDGEREIVFALRVPRAGPGASNASKTTQAAAPGGTLRGSLRRVWRRWLTHVRRLRWGGNGAGVSANHVVLTAHSLRLREAVPLPLRRFAMALADAVPPNATWSEEEGWFVRTREDSSSSSPRVPGDGAHTKDAGTNHAATRAVTAAREAVEAIGSDWHHAWPRVEFAASAHVPNLGRVRVRFRASVYFCGVGDSPSRALLGWTELHKAAAWNDARLVRLLMRTPYASSSALRVRTADARALTAFELACVMGHTEVALELLWASSTSLSRWFGSLDAGSPSSSSSTTAASSSPSGKSFLHLAIENGHDTLAACLVEHLSAGSAEHVLSSPDATGSTPLHAAARHPDPNMTHVVRSLIMAGVDVAAQDLEGDTPLLAACRVGNVDSATALLHASSVARLGGDGAASGGARRRRGRGGGRSTRFRGFWGGGRSSGDEMGDDEGEFSSGGDPASEAPRNNPSSAAKPNLPNKRGERALDVAASIPTPEGAALVRELLACLAVPGLSRPDGTTALHVAAAHGCDRTVEVLLEWLATERSNMATGKGYVEVVESTKARGSSAAAADGLLASLSGFDGSVVFERERRKLLDAFREQQRRMRGGSTAAASAPAPAPESPVVGNEGEDAAPSPPCAEAEAPQSQTQTQTRADFHGTAIVQSVSLLVRRDAKGRFASDVARENGHDALSAKLREAEETERAERRTRRETETREMLPFLTWDDVDLGDDGDVVNEGDCDDGNGVAVV